MTKKEIIYLINLNKQRSTNYGISLLDDYKFPNIEELKDEFRILIEEKNKRTKLFESHSNELNQLRKKCDHTVRIMYPSGFCTNRICVVCGQSISTADNGTIYNDCNRNSYFCEFPGEFSDDDYSQEGVDIEIIRSYIYKILESKSDDEEVDLLQEMKRLKPDECTFTEKPFIKQHHILIIGGTNTIKLGTKYYATSKGNDISLDLTNYLISIPNVKVELLENPETYKTQKFEELFPRKYVNINAKFESYATDKELIEQLASLSETCPFDLIVDMSNIFDVEVRDNHIAFEEKKLNLESLFPNSKIVRFENISELYDYCESKSEFERRLLYLLSQKLLEKSDMAIGYSEQDTNVYYTLDSSNQSFQIVNGFDEVKKGVGAYIKK